MSHILHFIILIITCLRNNCSFDMMPGAENENQLDFIFRSHWITSNAYLNSKDCCRLLQKITMVISLCYKAIMPGQLAYCIWPSFVPGPSSFTEPYPHCSFRTSAKYTVMFCNYNSWKFAFNQQILLKIKFELIWALTQHNYPHINFIFSTFFTKLSLFLLVWHRNSAELLGK